MNGCVLRTEEVFGGADFVPRSIQRPITLPHARAEQLDIGLGCPHGDLIGGLQRRQVGEELGRVHDRAGKSGGGIRVTVDQCLEKV